MMTNLEILELAADISFWTNTITLGAFRLAVVAACIKYLWG